MAKQAGGIFGTTKGKVAGIVFSSARTREGKVVTAREKVTPANPKTAEQTLQRNKFSSALGLVKDIGPSIYQADWNRSVQQLPGFQSLMSIILNNIDDSLSFNAPPDTSLGNLHFPDTFSPVTGSSPGEIDVTWSNEAGANGLSTDLFIAFAIVEDLAQTALVAVSNGVQTRTSGATGVTLSGLAEGEPSIICGYFRGADANEGLLSLAVWQGVQAG